MPRSRVVDLFGRRVTRHVVTSIAFLVVFKIVFRRYHEFSTHSRTARATVARVRAARDVHGERAIDERGVDATSRECARVRRARRGAADASPTGR